MKKIFNIMAMSLLGASAFVSCTPEVADVFDNSAAERTAEAQKMYTELLVADGGKWQMEYFTNSDEPGYVYVMTFDKNGSVMIAGENKYIAKLTNVDATAPAYGEERSLWEVIVDNGPTLSFNSYNRVFHLFSNPEDVPDTEASEAGEGHLGDYEFTLMRYDGNKLYMTGKKHKIEIILTRLPQDVDDHTYLDEVVALSSKFFSPLIPNVYITLPNGARYLTQDGASLIMSMAPEANETRTKDQDADWISFVESHNAIITPEGLRFMEPITLYGTYEARLAYEAYWKANPEATTEPDIDHVYKVQNFELQDDGSLLCTDDGVTTITADALNKVFASTGIKWRVDLINSAGPLAEAFQEFLSGMTARDGSTVQSFDFILDHVTRDPATGDITEAFFAMDVVVRRRRGGTFKMDFYYQPVVNSNGTVTVNFDGTNNANANTYVTNVPAVSALCELLKATPLTPSAESRLAPTTMVLTAGEGNYITVNAFK